MQLQGLEAGELDSIPTVTMKRGYAARSAASPSASPLYAAGSSPSSPHTSAGRAAGADAAEVPRSKRVRFE